jgi:hypothetical protein
VPAHTYEAKKVEDGWVVLVDGEPVGDAVKTKKLATELIKQMRQPDEPKAKGKGVPQARTPQETIKEAVKLRKKGLGLPTIARQLNERGFKSATGKELRPQTIRQLLQNALGKEAWDVSVARREEARQTKAENGGK